MDNIPNITRMVVLITIVEQESITAAASYLGVSKAVVSKHLGLLEKELGVELVRRNTRHLHPTQLGMQFYQESKLAVDNARLAYQGVTAKNTEAEGSLTITAPLDYGNLFIAGIVGRFVALYPRIKINLLLTDDQIDLVGKQYDLAFRVGWIKNSSNRVRKIDGFSEWVVGSPSLAADISHMQPQDLENIPFVANIALKNNTKWTFKKKSKNIVVHTQSAVKMNGSLAIARVVSAGKCISILPDFMIREDVESGKLIRILPDWILREGGIYVLSPPAPYKSHSAQLFIDLVMTTHRNATH